MDNRVSPSDNDNKDRKERKITMSGRLNRKKRSHVIDLSETNGEIKDNVTTVSSENELKTVKTDAANSVKHSDNGKEDQHDSGLESPNLESENVSTQEETKTTSSDIINKTKQDKSQIPENESVLTHDEEKNKTSTDRQLAKKRDATKLTRDNIKSKADEKHKEIADGVPHKMSTETHSPGQLWIKVIGDLQPRLDSNNSYTTHYDISEFLKQIKSFTEETGSYLDLSDLKNNYDADLLDQQDESDRKQKGAPLYECLVLCNGDVENNKEIEKRNSIIILRGSGGLADQLCDKIDQGIYNNANKKNNRKFYTLNISKKMKSSKISQTILKAAKADLKNHDMTFFKLCLALDRLDAAEQLGGISKYIFKKVGPESKTKRKLCKDVLLMALLQSRYEFVRYMIQEDLDISLLNEVLDLYFTEISQDEAKMQKKHDKKEFIEIISNKVKSSSEGENLPKCHKDVYDKFLEKNKSEEYFDILKNVTNLTTIQDVVTYLQYLYKEDVKKDEDSTDRKFKSFHDVVSHLTLYKKDVKKDDSKDKGNNKDSTNRKLITIHDLVARLYVKKIKETDEDLTDRKLALYFIFSLLFGNYELSTIIWSKVKSCTAAALFAFGTLKVIRKRCTIDEEKEELMKYILKYKEFSLGTIDKTFKANTNETIKLLGCNLKLWGNINCIQLALKHGNRTFLTHSACKTLNDRTWYTGSFDKIDNEKKDNGEFYKNFREWLSPSVLVMFRFIGFLVFLFLFAIFLICVLETSHIHWIEWLLLLYIATMSAEQINQIIRNEINIRRGPIDLNVFAWLETFSLVLFVAAWILRVIAYLNPAQANAMSWARAVFSVDFMAFTISTLEICYTSKFLGPLLLMMIRMIKTLVQFIIIIMVICFAYAIASESVLYPQSRLTPHLIFFVLRKAFWAMFGEFNLDELEDQGTSCSNDPDVYNAFIEDRCPTKAGRYYVPPLLGIYYIIVNILLFNLLIAILNLRIQPIADKGLEVWQHQTVQLTMKYSRVIFLPPPFVVLSPLLWWCRHETSTAPFIQINKQDKIDLHRLEKTEQLAFIKQQAMLNRTEPVVKCNGRFYCPHKVKSEWSPVQGDILTSAVSNKADKILNKHRRPGSTRRYFATRSNSKHGIQWKVIGIKKVSTDHTMSRKKSVDEEAKAAISADIHLLD